MLTFLLAAALATSGYDAVDPFIGTCNTREPMWGLQRPYYDSRLSRIATHNAAPQLPGCPTTTDTPNLANVRDLARYPELRFLDRHKWLPLVVYALVMYAVAGPSGVVWGFVVSTILCLHATMCINSLSHLWGSRRYATSDDSRNNALLAFITLGEGWHNNHHFDMNAARQGRRFWELDVTYYSLKILEAVGIVWAVRPPSSRSRKPAAPLGT